LCDERKKGRGGGGDHAVRKGKPIAAPQVYFRVLSNKKVGIKSTSRRTGGMGVKKGRILKPRVRKFRIKKKQGTKGGKPQEKG